MISLVKFINKNEEASINNASASSTETSSAIILYDKNKCSKQKPTTTTTTTFSIIRNSAFKNIFKLPYSFKIDKISDDKLKENPKLY